ncbi:type II secretion system protein [Aeromicrobium sp.]|nr:type II secretion system protein [Candidatus Saccharibacteria bacterium]
MNRKQDGFTIPELLIMMIVTSILTVAVISFSMNYWSAAAKLQNSSESLVSRLNAGDALRDALNVSSGLISQNSIPDSHAGYTDPAAGPSYWLMLHAQPKTIPMPASGSITPIFYFQSPSVDKSRNFILNGVQSYQDEFVLYLDGKTKTLKLRSLINPSATNDRLKTSCPPAYISTTCPADKIFAEDVASVDTKFFSRSGNTIDYTSVVQKDTNGNPVVPAVYIGPDYPSAEVIELTIHLYRKSTVGAGSYTSNIVIVRVALRNG